MCTQDLCACTFIFFDHFSLCHDSLGSPQLCHVSHVYQHPLHLRVTLCTASQTKQDEPFVCFPTDGGQFLQDLHSERPEESHVQAKGSLHSERPEESHVQAKGRSHFTGEACEAS